MRILKKAWTYVVIVFIAFVAALNYELFVFPNQFAPAGLNGICTMIQYVTGISVGYLSLIINVPLALWCFVEVSKPMAIRSMLYVVTFSVALLIMDRLDLSFLIYSTSNGTSTILGPLVAGIIMGFCYSVLMKCSAYTGGTDFISAIIHKRHPEKTVLSLSFTINAMVAFSSYFVYNYKIEPVILCILYSFASTTVGDHFLRSGRTAIRFEIVTDQPEELSRDIITKLHHSATIMKANGAYSGKDTWIVVCVVNKTQVTALINLVRKYPSTFAMMSPVSQVIGSFRQLSGSGREMHSILDSGDGKTV